MSYSLLRLDVDALTHGGDAVARDEDGRVVFVRGACPGDEVIARVTEERPSFARAVVDQLVAPSDDRVEPKCAYFGLCGGCHWQHVAYTVQMEAKRENVIQALRRIGGLEHPPVADTIGTDAMYGYRNRIELSSPETGPLQLGFHGVDAEHVPVDTCELVPEPLRASPGRLSGALRYVQGADDLGIERVGLRVSTRAQSTAIDVWTRPGPFPRTAGGRTLAQSIGADSVSRVLARKEDKRRTVRGVETLEGTPTWREVMAGFSYAVSPPSFFQVNTAQAERLVDLVLSSACPGPGTAVLDAYSGVGTFTLPLAASGARVFAAEGMGSAIRDLRDNLAGAGLEAQILPGDVSRSVSEVGSADVVVVDPPRAGIDHAALEALVALGASRLVYVSCDPATFSRDASRLRELGYRLEGVTPVDLFPQTYHVEVVGSFDRTDFPT